MKRGIALLITIGFITIFISLIAYMLSMSDRVLKNSGKIEYRNQNSLLYRDTKVIIDRFAKDIKNSTDLENLLSEASYLSYSSDDLTFRVELQPLSNKLNINSILIGKKIDKNIVKFIQNISAKYNIIDVEFFINLILDTIDKDDSPREVGSEIILKDITFSNSRIVNFRHFKTILDYYVLSTEDKNILKVPWRELIFFGEKKKDILDCDRIDKTLVDILGFDVESYKGCADLNESKEYEEIAKNYNLKEFSKGDNYYILVKIVQTKDFMGESISFVYDLKTNRVSEIEFFYN